MYYLASIAITQFPESSSILIFERPGYIVQNGGRLAHHQNKKKRILAKLQNTRPLQPLHLNKNKNYTGVIGTVVISKEIYAAQYKFPRLKVSTKQG